jgi:hypothetical protein
MYEDLDTCYRNSNKTCLPLAQFASDRNRDGLLDSHLAYGNYAYLEPAIEISRQLENEVHQSHEHQANLDIQPEPLCNAERWRFHYTGKIFYIILILKLMCFPFAWASWEIGFFGQAALEFESQFLAEYAVYRTIVMSVVMVASLVIFMINPKAGHYVQLIGVLTFGTVLLYLRGSLWGLTDLHLAYWISVSIYLMGAIVFDLILILYGLYEKPDESEFNRMDGMVRFRRRFRRPFVAPFEEFDPVLRAIPTGILTREYTIVLRHRYTDNSQTLAAKLHSTGLDKVNALAFWDSLQRYMDVTQPLPDLPMLEQSRHLDPVTAEHDERTGRPERRWRDQALTGWKTGGARRLQAQLEQHPWQQHDCIIKARLCRKLRIQDYYRALETKGLEITPESKNYQCLGLPER